MRWLRDIYGNTIAVIEFSEPGQKLSLRSEANVNLYDDSSIDCLIEAVRRCTPSNMPRTSRWI